jgi:tetratricopeptide (TPR) repeat protein
MARADRRRVRSAKSHAGSGTRKTPRRDSDLAAIEDTLFFTRIRSHAKWVFVFLALSFLIGFVIFNVGGSGSGGGIGELLRDGGGGTSGNISVSDAREQVQKTPKSAQAQRNLATALETAGETDEAIVALTRYLELKPKDQDALRELAGLHLGQGSKFAQEAQIAQQRASYVTFGSTFSSPLDLGDGATIGPDPIDQAIATKASEAVSAAYTKAQTSFTSAEQAYQRLVVLAPKDPNIQLELAQAAQQSGDYATAIASYQTFLKLAPDDPSAGIVKQQIAQLKAAQASPSSG